MNEFVVTYPRIPSPAARAILQGYRNLTIEDLRHCSATSHQQREWHPTVSNRVSTEDLNKLREAVLDIAQRHGFPVLKSRGGYYGFDQDVAIHLYDTMNLVPAEASAGGVWSFLSLVLLPDIAAWRWTERTTERFIGSDTMIGSSNRHVFGRLWARAYVFGPDLLPRLGEDNIEGIFGRPIFGGNVRTARAIAATLVRIGVERRITNNQNLLRDAMKRLRRLAYVINFNGLEGDQLRDLLYEVFTASADALQSNQQ